MGPLEKGEKFGHQDRIKLGEKGGKELDMKAHRHYVRGLRQRDSKDFRIRILLTNRSRKRECETLEGGHLKVARKKRPLCKGEERNRSAFHLEEIRVVTRDHI